MEDISTLIMASAYATIAITGLLTFFVTKFHIEGRIAKGLVTVNKDANVVVANADKIDAGVVAAKAISPEVQALLDNHKTQIQAATAAVQNATDNLSKLQDALTKPTA